MIIYAKSLLCIAFRSGYLIDLKMSWLSVRKNYRRFIGPRYLTLEPYHPRHVFNARTMDHLEAGVRPPFEKPQG